MYSGCICCCLPRKHPGQHLQNRGLSRFINSSEVLHETRLINRADLVEGNLSVLALEDTRHTRRIVSGSRCHRSDQRRSDVPIHLVGRNHQARPCLLDFHSFGRIKFDEKNIKTLNYHSHSSWSHCRLGASFNINLSSPLAAMRRNASSQPSRAGFGLRMTRQPPCASTSTSLCKLHASSNGCGTGMTGESPSWTILDFT
jgi:hypothetical protein